MRYDQPRLRSLLAAQYVLGTLRGPARARFVRLSAQDADLRAEVTRWEARFHVLQKALPPLRPREQIWLEIERIIRAQPATAFPPPTQSLHIGTVPAAPTTAANNRFWQNWAAIATAVSLALIATLIYRLPSLTPAPTPVAVAPPPTPAPSYVALVQMPNSTMHWTLSIAPGKGRMTALAGGDPPPLGGHSPELWWLSPSGPVALGVLPVTGGGTMPLPKEIASVGEIKLAVTIEPAGGSPNGKPSGAPVVVTTAIQAA
jgi:anti-sigma-K factor RskA